MKKYFKILALPILTSIIFIIIFITNIPKIKYKYNAEYDGYFITDVKGNAEYYEIKEYYKDLAVVGIDEHAFDKHNNLKEINLPSTIKFIGRMAFFECTKLEKINLDDVYEIERNAFSYCANLKEINLNASYIGASAFYKCSSLSNVDLNNTISIGTLAFSNTKIKNINIPSTCNFLGQDAFYECYLLENINVYGKSLKSNSYLKSLAIVNYIEKE